MRKVTIMLFFFLSVFVLMSSCGKDSKNSGPTGPSFGEPHDISGITFVAIPGGTFQMGDVEGVGEPEEIPVHSVTVTSFEMSIYEITNAQYAKYLNEALFSGEIAASDLRVTGKTGDWSEKYYIELNGVFDHSNKCWISYSDSSFTVEDGKEDWPVVFVTWYGAKAFAEFYGFDLPREAEWEYASSGGMQYTYGTDDGTINDENANYHWNTDYPTNVGSYPANPYGLYDVSGNVWEWCNDWYYDYTSASVTDPTGATSGSDKVRRGGGWDRDAGYCRSTSRLRITPRSWSDSLGFRVVRRPYQP